MLAIEVEDNPNCNGVPMLVFPTVGESRPVHKVRILRPGGGSALFDVTGWSSANGGSSTTAHYVRVEDSGGGFSYLIYGDDWGLRFKPADSEEPWDLTSPSQWGEPFLVIVDRADILEAEPG